MPPISMPMALNATPTPATHMAICTALAITSLSSVPSQSANRCTCTMICSNTGSSFSPSSIASTINVCFAFFILASVVSLYLENASSSMPVVSAMFSKICLVASMDAPVKSKTPDNARTLPNTAAAAASLPSNFSRRVSNTDNNPSSLICLRSSSDDSPMPARASSACLLGFNNDVMIPLN